MSRPKSLKPAYSLQKPDRAFVKLDGHKVYLGKHGSQESRDAYDREIGQWIARGRQAPPKPASSGDAGAVPQGITIVELAAAFWEHVKDYCRKPDGNPTAQLEHFRTALKILNRLYGSTPAEQFGSLAMKTVRAEMLKPTKYVHPTTKKTLHRKAWSRKYANAQIARLRRMLDWGMESELLPDTYAGKYLAITKTKNLRYGQAREGDKVKPVADANVDMMLAHVPRQVKAMIELQRHTGARPGEICSMRGCDIDMSNPKCWMYRPPQHKGAHREEVREIRIGPRAQAILKDWLRPNLQEHLFSPAEADAEHRAARALARKTPMNCGNRTGSNRQRQPKKAPGTRYSVNSYRQAIARGCAKADRKAREAFEKAHPGEVAPAVFVATFKPHQLRHTAATRIRKEFGLEASAVIIGDRTLSAAQIYAEQDGDKATEIVAKIG